MSKSSSQGAKGNPKNITREESTTLTVAQNVAHMIRTMLQDTICFSLNKPKLKVGLEIEINPSNEKTPAHNALEITLENEEIADQFFECIDKAHSPELSKKIEGDFFRIYQKKNKIVLSTNNLKDIAVLVEAIVETIPHTISCPKKALSKQDLNDKDLVNQRFIPTEFGFPSKQKLIEFYNRASQQLSDRPYAVFSYTPNDIRLAVEGYIKLANATKGLSPHQTLMIH